MGSAPIVVPKPTVVGAVNQANAVKAPRPKSLVLGNTDALDNPYVHGLIFGDTSTRKTTTAATFDTAEKVRIIATRRVEQLLSLKNLGYQYVQTPDVASLTYALMYPESLWPEWAQIEGRTLVIDDVTRAVELLVEDATEEVGDQFGRNYQKAGESLKELIRLNFDKPQHVVLTALAKVRENSISNEEQVNIDLPTSMKNFLSTELEFSFYIQPRGWKFITDRQTFTFKAYDPEQKKERLFTREIFAKNKIPVGLKDQGIIKIEEPMLAPNGQNRLRELFEKVKEAKAQLNKGAK